MRGKIKNLVNRVQVKWRLWGHRLSEIWYGLTGYEFVLTLRQDYDERERLLSLLLFGDLLGLPFFPPYFSLRLFPYFLPKLTPIRARLLTERDIMELIARGGG